MENQTVNHPLAHGDSVAQQCPAESDVIHIPKEILRESLDFPVRTEGRTEILMDALDLVCVGIQTAVGSDDPVIAEIVVIFRIIVIEISGVGPDFLSGLPFPAERLVDEVPYISPLIAGIFADRVPVFPETSHGVSHRMGVLTLNQRFAVFA